MQWIDLRSDTATRPTREMRAVMAAAEVGDDVVGEDPTINQLQERVARMFGHEAALFVPSGTMSNQIAIKAHTQPGDEILIESTSHVYVWEAGGPAVLSGATCRTIEGDYGVLDVHQLHDKIRPGNDHYVQTRMVSLENTHNRGGGRVYPIDKIREIREWTRKHDLILHLDGARIWNAIVATGTSAAEWGGLFDSISVCFSKGLGAPVGSALIGSKAFIDRARRARKLFGGGMRQAGIIAAAALYAVDHHVERLAEDHRNAQVIAAAIRDSKVLRLEPEYVETNLVWFEIDPRWMSGKEFSAALREHGILVHGGNTPTARACTHLDVSSAQATRAAEVIHSLTRK